MTRGLGPHLGWLGGWAIVVADVVVMANLAQIAGLYSFLLVGADGAAASTFWVTFVGVVWIVGMTAIVTLGIQLAARTQWVLLAAEYSILVVFAVVALVKVYAQHPAGSVHVAWSWFSPASTPSTNALIAGVLLATGFACVVFYRAEITKSLRNLLLIGLGPFVGAGMLAYIFVKSCINLADPANSSSGNSWFGLGPPLVIGGRGPPRPGTSRTARRPRRPDADRRRARSAR